MTSSQTRLLGTENSTKVYLLFSKKSRGLEKSDSSKIETDQKLISYLNVGFQEQLIETLLMNQISRSVFKTSVMECFILPALLG